MAKKGIKFLEAGRCFFCGNPVKSRLQPYETEDVEADGTYRQAYKDIYCSHCGVSYTEWHRVEYILDSIQFGDDDWKEVDTLHIGDEIEIVEEDNYYD